MTYSVSLRRRARKQLEALDRAAYDRVLDSIRALQSDPRPPGCRRLVGKHVWRLRVGDYRVIYEIDDDGRAVDVTDIFHRREAYR